MARFRLTEDVHRVHQVDAAETPLAIRRVLDEGTEFRIVRDAHPIDHPDLEGEQYVLIEAGPAGSGQMYLLRPDQLEEDVWEEVQD